MIRMLPHTSAAILASAPKQRAMTAEKSFRWFNIGSSRFNELAEVLLKAPGGFKAFA